MAYATVDPELVDVRIARHHPRVVVVGEQVDFIARSRGLQVLEERRGEQEIAELVALEDEDLKGRRL